MAAQLGNDPIQVGAILRDTRKREGIDIDTVEQRTKIRVKYLRALEEEDWEVLPGPAYARGFIRAYADLLGLDSEVLVDEYRRRHEEQPTESYEPVEPLLRGRSAGERPRPATLRYAVLGALAAAVAAALLVLGVTAGGGGGGGRRPGDPPPSGEGHKQGRGG